MVFHPRLSFVHASPCAGSCDCQVIPGGCGLREAHVRQQMHMSADHLKPIQKNKIEKCPRK